MEYRRIVTRPLVDTAEILSSSTGCTNLQLGIASWDTPSSAALQPRSRCVLGSSSTGQNKARTSSLPPDRRNDSVQKEDGMPVSVQRLNFDLNVAPDEWDNCLGSTSDCKWVELAAELTGRDPRRGKDASQRSIYDFGLEKLSSASVSSASKGCDEPEVSLDLQLKLPRKPELKFNWSGTNHMERIELGLSLVGSCMNAEPYDNGIANKDSEFDAHKLSGAMPKSIYEFGLETLSSAKDSCVDNGESQDNGALAENSSMSRQMDSIVASSTSLVLEPMEHGQKEVNMAEGVSRAGGLESMVPRFNESVVADALSADDSEVVGLDGNSSALSKVTSDDEVPTELLYGKGELADSDEEDVEYEVVVEEASDEEIDEYEEVTEVDEEIDECEEVTEVYYDDESDHSQNAAGDGDADVEEFKEMTREVSCHDNSDGSQHGEGAENSRSESNQLHDGCEDEELGGENEESSLCALDAENSIDVTAQTTIQSTTKGYDQKAKLDVSRSRVSAAPDVIRTWPMKLKQDRETESRVEKDVVQATEQGNEKPDRGNLGTKLNPGKDTVDQKVKLDVTRSSASAPPDVTRTWPTKQKQGRETESRVEKDVVQATEQGNEKPDRGNLGTKLNPGKETVDQKVKSDVTRYSASAAPGVTRTWTMKQKQGQETESRVDRDAVQATEQGNKKPDRGNWGPKLNPSKDIVEATEEHNRGQGWGTLGEKAELGKDGAETTQDRMSVRGKDGAAANRGDKTKNGWASRGTNPATEEANTKQGWGTWETNSGPNKSAVESTGKDGYEVSRRENFPSTTRGNGSKHGSKREVPGAKGAESEASGSLRKGAMDPARPTSSYPKRKARDGFSGKSLRHDKPHLNEKQSQRRPHLRWHRDESSSETIHRHEKNMNEYNRYGMRRLDYTWVRNDQRHPGDAFHCDQKFRMAENEEELVASSSLKQAREGGRQPHGVVINSYKYSERNTLGFPRPEQYSPRLSPRPFEQQQPSRPWLRSPREPEHEQFSHPHAYHPQPVATDDVGEFNPTEAPCIAAGDFSQNSDERRLTTRPRLTQEECLSRPRYCGVEPDLGHGRHAQGAHNSLQGRRNPRTYEGNVRSRLEGNSRGAWGSHGHAGSNRFHGTKTWHEADAEFVDDARAKKPKY